MFNPTRHSSFEPLENRIAPAAFYVSGTSLEIDNAAGVSQPGDSGAATAAGATQALLLHAGDRLYFNPDGDVTTHATDHLWVSVTAGNALVFLQDFNGDSSFSLDELSGLAVGDRFSGSVFSDIHGSVATMLDRAGHFTPDTLQRASISRLSVTGALVSATDGYTNILAGVGISNLTVLGQSSTDGLSVNGLVATGSQALNFSWGFGGPTSPFDPAKFQHVIGTSGGDVIHAHFSGGLRGILTGDGEETPDGLRGNAGSGGSIVNVTMGISPEGFLLQTGKGGNAGSATGPALGGTGGPGGSIIGVRAAFHSSLADYPMFTTGAGGFGAAANGGAGGSIIDSSFRDLDPALSFLLQTGKGGGGSGVGNGGAGGSIVNTSVVLLGDLGTTEPVGGEPQRSGGDFDIVLGSGGAVDSQDSRGGQRPSTGAGGSWDWFSTTKNPALQQAVSGGTNAAITTQALAAFHLTAGDAGDPGVPGFHGTGGSILGGRFNFRGALGILGDGEFTATSGRGADSSSSAGAAGRFEDAVFSFGGPVQFDQGDFRVTGGGGGRLVGDPGSLSGGRDGGALNRLVFDFHDTVAIGGEFSFTAGEGGEDGGILGNAGNGGAINGLAILATRGIDATLAVSSGQGGFGGTFAPSGATGAGGDVSNLLIQTPSLGGLTLAGGDGGFHFGIGEGGGGGDLSTGLAPIPHPIVDASLAARLQTPAGVYVSGAVGNVELHLGAGASGGASSGRGGHGGSLLDSRFVFGSIENDLLVSGGGGGDGNADGGDGGKSGGIGHASFQVASDVGRNVSIALGHGGDTAEFASTGSGGDYSHLALNVGGNVNGTLAIFAPRAGELGSRIGGSGGAIDHLHLDVGDIRGGSRPDPDVPVSLDTYSLQIAAGRGEGATKGGAGGGITDSLILTKALTYGAFLVTGDGGDSQITDAGAGGSLIHDHVVFGGNIDGNFEVYAGGGGTTGGRGAPARGGSISSTDISLQAAVDVTITAGNNGSSLGDGVAGGAISGLTLENTGPVHNVRVEAGVGTGALFASGQAGAGGPIIGSTYSNLGGAGVVTVMTGGGGALLGEAPGTHGAAGAGGTLAGFTFNNAAPLVSAGFSGGPGGAVQMSGEPTSGRGGHGGWVTGFTLHDSAGPASLTYLRGGDGGTSVGAGLRGAGGGAVLKTSLDTDGVVVLTGGNGGEFSEYHDHTVGGFGGSVRSVTGRVGQLSVIAGNAGSGTVGGWGGGVRGVVLSEVSGFVRLLQGGLGGSGVATAGVGGFVASVFVPGDIGDFNSAFGSGTGAGLDGMGGLVAGQGGPRDAVFAGPAGRISSVTANRIAAIYASDIGFDGQQAVASITNVRASEIGADTGLPGDVDAPSLRGYGTYTYDTTDGRDTPVDGPVIVRASGYTAHSLSAVPLFLILAPG